MLSIPPRNLLLYVSLVPRQMSRIELSRKWRRGEYNLGCRDVRQRRYLTEFYRTHTRLSEIYTFFVRPMLSNRFHSE